MRRSIVGPVAEQDVDDTILTSGHVVFDDSASRTSSRRSPAASRASTRSSGERVKKGDAARDHRVARHRHRVERRRQGARGPHRRRARLQAQEGSLRAARGVASRLEQARGQLAQGESRARARAQKARLLRARRRRPVTRLHAHRADRRRGARAQHEPGHRGAGAVRRRHRHRALHHRRARQGLGHRRRLRDGSRARQRRRARAASKIVSYRDTVFEGKVDWVCGMLDPNDAHGQVRCTSTTPIACSSPEMYATVSISVDEKKALAIPRDAHHSASATDGRLRPRSARRPTGA